MTTINDEQAQNLKESISALEAATASIASGIDDNLVTGDQVYNLLWTIIHRIKERSMCPDPIVSETPAHQLSKK